MHKFWIWSYTAVLFAIPIYAVADYNATTGGPTIFRAFDATHGGTSLCAAANMQCQGIVPITSAGAEIVPATAANQTNASQKSQIVDGSGNVIASTSNALNVNVNNANANGQAVMASSSPVVIASNQSAVPVAPQAATSGGASSYHVLPVASDNHAVPKNGAGTAYGIFVTNNSATKNYFRLYDAGTGFNGCNSATGIILGGEIPPTDSGVAISFAGAVGVAFSTGLSVCITSGYGDTDTTNATASAMSFNLFYK